MENNRTVIVYAHPYAGSFNHAVLDTVRERLAARGREAVVLDLYADGFNPAMEADSLRLYSRGETADPLARRYLQTLTEADECVFIFPVWWGMMPAVVKGFFDKVLLSGTAYAYGPEGTLVPARISMRRTLLLTTSQAPTEYFAPFFGDYLPSRVLAPVGMAGARWLNCAMTAHGPAENREEFLRRVAEEV